MSENKNITVAADGRRIVAGEEKSGIKLFDLLLAAILLAAGQVLKTTVGTMIATATGGAIKPNFIIAMYCLAILLIKPKKLNLLFVGESAVIGLLAGALNQISPATPLINFGSELIGALAMCFIAMIPMAVITKAQNEDGTITETRKGLPLAAEIILKSAPGTFVATLFSGFSFVALQYALLGVKLPGMEKAISLPDNYIIIFCGVIFGTAGINALIVTVLYPALKRVLKK
ncbi:MAG: hypothetical protein LBQ80_04325 [Clostridium sp.]|jgi:hypothetical protein|nr:hypothetical protein [Clostridium sp.]